MSAGAGERLINSLAADYRFNWVRVPAFLPSHEDIMFPMITLGIMGTTIAIFLFIIGWSGIVKSVKNEMGKSGAPENKNVSTFRLSVIFLITAWIIMTITVMAII